ncbi:T9SS type A sorting domain-containing protein [uncultured Winogradskyella sp.]
MKDIKLQEQSSTLDISNLESGLYFVELTAGNSKTIEKLMVD